MSDFGLYSGWYAQLRDYSELVDDVLLQSLSGSAVGDDVSRRRLSALFQSLAGKTDADPKRTPLRIWMSRHIRLSPAQWQALAEAVLRASSDDTTIERLGQVARQLDLHRAQVLYDMRGR